MIQKTTCHGLALSTSARIDNIDRFLVALGAAPVAAKPPSLDFAFTGSATDYLSQTDLVSGRTRSAVELDVVFEDAGPVARGRIKSDRMSQPDIRAAAQIISNTVAHNRRITGSSRL